MKAAAPRLFGISTDNARATSNSVTNSSCRFALLVDEDHAMSEVSTAAWREKEHVLLGQKIDGYPAIRLTGPRRRRPKSSQVLERVKSTARSTGGRRARRIGIERVKTAILQSASDLGSDQQCALHEIRRPQLTTRATRATRRPLASRDASPEIRSCCRSPKSSGPETDRVR